VEKTENHEKKKKVEQIIVDLKTHEPASSSLFTPHIRADVNPMSFAEKK